VTRIYDLVMTHKLDTDDFFIHRVQQHCAEAGLNFFLLEPLWVEPFHIYLSLGAILPRVLLNMHSEHHQPHDIYHRLVKLAADKGAKVIDPPDLALAAFDKGRLHPRLVAAGINVPQTVVVSNEETVNFKLSDADRAALGSPFVIKPSLGYGRRGVVMDATGEGDLARSVAAWPYGGYLLQRRIVPRALKDWPMYFRVFFVFGSVWLCWWNCYNDNYRLVTPQARAEFKLDPLEEIIRKIAALTGMNFFSSEIAQTESGEFVVIDYVNDQCHMLSQSANPKIGVPDELVAAIAHRVVGAVKEMVAKK
jgi:glutathione synthase/RimK-type ligase-like ATP-grasp enzyme